MSGRVTLTEAQINNLWLHHSLFSTHAPHPCSDFVYKLDCAKSAFYNDRTKRLTLDDCRARQGDETGDDFLDLLTMLVDCIKKEAEINEVQTEGGMSEPSR